MKKEEIRFEKTITYKGEQCDAVHVNTNSFSDIPDNLIEKSHGVCVYNNKLLIVYHPKWDIWSIPGGSREEGESIIDTLHREVLEEANCRIVSAESFAYQKIESIDGDMYFRSLFLCDVIPEGDFLEDVAGGITEIKWIEFDEYEKYIEDKPFKKEIVKRGIELYKKNN